MSGQKKPTRTEQMRVAIANGKKAKVAAAPTPPWVKATPVPDASNEPKKERSFNHRTAKARDARAKARGRLPVKTNLRAAFNGVEWFGELFVDGDAGLWVKTFAHKADGLFRLMEELDIMFWDWFTRAPKEEKERLTFVTDPPPPQPWTGVPTEPPVFAPPPPASAPGPSPSGPACTAGSPD
jgi:hypothetical protein